MVFLGDPPFSSLLPVVFVVCSDCPSVYRKETETVMHSPEQYERPMITTIPASRIIESMGPVSAGSGSGMSVLPIDGGFQHGVGGGYGIPTG